MSEAVRDLVETCCVYLCSKDFDDETVEDDIDNNLLLGKFRFLGFASFNWLPLVRTLLRLSNHEANLKPLLPFLEELSSKRRNYKLTKDEGELQAAETVLALPESPATSEFLSKAARFFQDPRQDEWTIDNGTTLVSDFLSVRMLILVFIFC